MEYENDQDTLGTSNNSPAFALLLRRQTGLVLPPEGSLQIGVSFSPRRLGLYKGFVEVRSNVNGRALLWCYPLAGLTEVGSLQHLPRMVTQCKSSIIREVVIHLEGLKARNIPLQALDLSDFEIENTIDPTVTKCVSRAFRIQPIEVVIVTDKPGVDYGIKCRILFEPLKEFNSTVEILVASRARGQWRASVQLEATPPNPDDVIELEAAVGTEDRVQFQLANRFLGYSKFQAYFEFRSSPHFKVEPASGVLAPYGSAGSTFTVVFKPREYGIPETGILTVVTDEAQWSYKVSGRYPALEVRR